MEPEYGWTDSRTLKFIDLLRQHEVLWKIDREDYSDRVKRLKALNAIGKEMGVTGEQRRFFYFRTTGFAIHNSEVYVSNCK